MKDSSQKNVSYCFHKKGVLRFFKNDKQCVKDGGKHCFEKSET